MNNFQITDLTDFLKTHFVFQSKKIKKNGDTWEGWFRGSADRINDVLGRYIFDEFLAETWHPLFTESDFWSFGIWYNRKTFQILTYSEGDIGLLTCCSKDNFNHEMKIARRKS